MNEKHYIHQIMVEFMSNPNFTIEEYVKLVNKSHLKYSKRLLTYKAFKKFKEDKQLTEQKIINYSKGNILTALFSASPSNTETEIRTYCEKNKGSLACSCYEAVKVGADIYRMTYDKYVKTRDKTIAINSSRDGRYRIHLEKYKNNLKKYINNLRNYEVRQENPYFAGPCCAWNYCECDPKDTFEVVKMDNYGWGTGCFIICRYKQTVINSKIKEYKDINTPKKPQLLKVPDRPAKLTINTNCCVNEIANIENIKNVVQSCNQNIISIIKTEEEERKRKEEGERKRKEEEERKRKEEEERKKKEEEERKRKEEEERKRKEEEDKEDKEPKKKEDDKKENNQIKNIIYISIGVSFILLLLFILLRKK